MRERYAEQFGEGLLFLDEEQFDQAILGVAERCAFGPVMVYDAAKVIALLAEDGLNEDEAREHFEYNVAGTYMGEYTPLFLYRLEQ